MEVGSGPANPSFTITRNSYDAHCFYRLWHYKDHQGERRHFTTA